VRVVVFIAVLLAAVFAFATFLRKTGMFFPDKFPVGRWDVRQFNVTPTEHTFATSDGVKLHAWLFRAAKPDAPMIVWCHGNAGNLTDRADMAAEFARRGVSVFLFDWRGFGKSGGRVSESKLYLDALAAHDYAKTLGARSIAMYGESIGGPYAAYVAKERRDVRAVIIENSFSCLTDLGNALYFPPLGYFAPFAMRTTDWLNQSNAKVLVMHGKRDAVIPYALGKRLFDGLRVEKEMLTSDSAGHCEIPLFDAQRYYEAVVRFVQ
jgi:uncharacterized protein